MPITRLPIREAVVADAPAIHAFLAMHNMETDGLLAVGSRYWVIEMGGQVIACVGLEYGPHAVLLRSAAVRSDLRSQGIGTQLFAHSYTMALADGRQTVYCFSTGAGEYWTRQGFREVPVSEVCAALPDSYQVQHYTEIGALPTEVAWRRDLA